MKSKKIAIIGGGILGSVIGYYLVKNNFEVSIFHQNKIPGQCASSVPLALFNPAAALKAKKAFGAEIAYSQLTHLFKEIDFNDYSTGVLRPGIDDDLLKNFSNSYLKEDWPKGWIEWLDETQVLALSDDLIPFKGALYVHASFTIDMPKLLSKLLQSIESLGGKVYHQKAINIKSKNELKILETDKSEFEFDKVIFANGYGLNHFKEMWGHLPLHFVKGHTLKTSTNDKLNPPCSMSARGYIAKHQDSIVFGSTYEHVFENLDIEADKADYLLNKSKFYYSSDVNSLINEYTLWNGVRVSTPDRKPILGEHHTLKNIFIATGVGSKGLLYSTLIATQISEFLINSISISKEFDINRIYKNPKYPIDKINFRQ